MLRLPQRAGAIKRTILLIVIAAAVLVYSVYFMVRAHNMAVAKANIAQKLGIPLERILPPRYPGELKIIDSNGKKQGTIYFDKRNEIGGRTYLFPYPSDFTTKRYSPSALAEIVKQEVARFLSEAPENISCTVNSENKPMLYVYCHSTVTGRRYKATIVYQDGLGFQYIVRVWESEQPNDPTPH